MNREKDEIKKREKVKNIKEDKEKKKLLTKGSKEKRGSCKVMGEKYLENKEEKLVRVREKKRKVIKKVIAQNRDKVMKKLETVFKVREKESEMKKEVRWINFKNELIEVRETTDEIYDAVLGLIPERKKERDSPANIKISDGTKLIDDIDDNEKVDEKAENLALTDLASIDLTPERN